MTGGSVETRLMRTRIFAGAKLVAATRTADRVWVTFLSGADPAAVAAEFGQDCLSLKQIGGGLLAVLSPETSLETEPFEPNLMSGRNVLLAIRNGEPAALVIDWLRYHRDRFGTNGALILDRSRPEVADDFTTDLRAGVTPYDPPVVLVRIDAPLGASDMPPAHHPAMAPGAPERVRAAPPEPDAWTAPFGETILLETLRRRFLMAARAVAFLDIADLMLPDAEGTPFDRAATAPGRVVQLLGREIYPWRLRQNAPAHFSDHICSRLGEQRWVPRWCVAPTDVDGETFWRMIRVGGATTASGAPAHFLRAMGVAFPGAPIGQIVAKSELVEDATALSLIRDVFAADPIRMPKRATAVVSHQDQRQVCIVTAMKNEGAFLIDWLAHHRALGIKQFLVFSNDCADGTDTLLNMLADEEILEHRQNPFRETGGVPQHAAFRAAEKEEIVTGADWLLTLDVDEYINIHAGHGRIDDLFDAVPDATMISMPWRLFGNADRHDFDAAPVVRQFPLCAPAFCPKPHQAWGFKTLYRNAGLFRRLSVHRPKGMNAAAAQDIRWVNGSGQPMPPTMWRSAWRMGTGNWGYELVSINHYAVRSAESFLVKRDRGRVNHTDRDQGLAYWFRMNHNAVEDGSIRRMDDAVEIARAELMALPGVAAAHQVAIDWHRTRITTLKADADHAELFRAITSPRMEKLSRMLSHFGTNVFLAGPEGIPDEIVARDPSEEFQFTVPRFLRP